VIQLDPDAAARVTDRQVSVQAPIVDPKIIEVTECLAGKESELWVMPLGLKLGDDNDRQNDPMLGESADGRRIGQQDAGVQDVCPPPRGCAGGCSLGPDPAGRGFGALSRTRPR